MEVLIKVDSDNKELIKEAISLLNGMLGIEYPDNDLYITNVFSDNQPSVESSPVVQSELDCRGLPWDGRVHSSSKAKLKNGQWKPMRGVDPDLLKSVEDELMGGSAPTPPMVENNLPEPPAPPVTPPSNVTPINAPTPEQPSMVVGESTTLFQDFMVKVTQAGINIEQLNQACAAVNLPTVNTLLANTHLIPQVKTLLGINND